MRKYYEVLFIWIYTESNQPTELDHDCCIRIVSSCDCFFAFKAYKDKRSSKFRELSIISILTLIAAVLITITNFQSNQSNDNQFRNSLHFIEIVSKELEVEKETVYVNSKFTVTPL